MVVVGYGSQKQSDLTGSVSSVSSSDLSKETSSNVENLLEGKVSGLNVVQRSGIPGRTQTSMLIRGLGTFGASSNPLVLIDGVEGSLSSLNPDDIKSISVLKDASSAAIYGARAANGVILVTTKNGQKNGIKISYHNKISVQQPAHLPDLIHNSATYMEMYNRAAKHSNVGKQYPQSLIKAYRQNGGSVRYPNFDWQHYMFRNALKQQHNISVSGGNNGTMYRASLGYLNQPGIVNYYGYKRYNFQLNLNTKVNKVIHFGGKISLEKGKRKRGYSLTSGGSMLEIYSQAPTYRPYLPDGSGRYASAAFKNAPFHNRNPVAIGKEGHNLWDNYTVRSQAFLTLDFTPHLEWKTKAAANLNLSYHKYYGHGANRYIYQPDSTGNYELADNNYPFFKGVRQDNNRSTHYKVYSTITFNKNLNKNNHIKLLGGTSIVTTIGHSMSAQRRNLPSYQIPELDVGASDTQQNSGTGYQWALQSFFGRINYKYKGKYLLEVNARYDGSSRLAPHHRWGVFPSASIGWRISKEKFLNSLDWLDEFKLRASYGELGNQQIGNYPYQEVLNLTSYPYSSSNVQQGAYLQRLTDQSLKWETTTMLDVGLDYSMLNGLFSFTADYYRKNTTNILFQEPIPYSAGLSPPTVNYGAMLNRGIDLTLQHKNNIGQLQYDISANFSKNINKVTKLVAPNIGGHLRSKVGLPWQSYYMYKWIGIFQSQKDINNSPTQPYKPKPGDLKLKDQNGDGKINSKDKVYIPGKYPDFTYSFKLNFNWKNFDLSLFFNGVYGKYVYRTNWLWDPFTQGTPPQKKFKNAWTPQNHTNSVPALYVGFSGYAPITGYNSTYYLHNASYLRLKNINLGYTFPTSFLINAIKSLRLFVSSQNVFVITPYKGIDPETGSNPEAYGAMYFPQLRSITGGINISF